MLTGERTPLQNVYFDVTKNGSPLGRIVFKLCEYLHIRLCYVMHGAYTLPFLQTTT